MSRTRWITLFAVVLGLGIGGVAVADPPLITGAEIQDESLTGADVQNDSLTGDDVLESTLGQVATASRAGAANALTTYASPNPGGPGAVNFKAQSFSIESRDWASAALVVNCPQGYYAIGGGASIDRVGGPYHSELADLYVDSSYPKFDSTGWVATIWNDTSGAQPVTVYASCVKVVQP